MAPDEFNFVLPEPASGATVVFAPTTRSRLGSAHAAVEGVGERIEALVDGMTVTIDWEANSAAPAPDGREVMLRIERSGEPVQLLSVIPTPAVGLMDLQMLQADLLNQVCARRSELAGSCPAHHFLFALDRTSEGALLECTDVSDAERSFRRTMFCELISKMCERLRKRRNGREDVPLIANAAWVHYTSCVIRAAADVFEGDHGALARTLEGFAAGDYRERVHVTMSDHYQSPLWIAEPDSSYIFFFAEFALVAIEHCVHVDMWQTLLPSLVKMQRYYLSRWTEPPALYGRPTDVLSCSRREEINRTYRRLSTEAELLAMFRRNLEDMQGHLPTAC